MQEVITRKKIIERSKEIFVAADSSKFGRDVTIGVAPISKIDYLITDSSLNMSLASGFRKHKLKLILAGDAEEKGNTAAPNSF